MKTSDYASWYTTAKFQPYRCYRPAKTGSYSFGGDQVFPADDYRPEVNGPGDFPMPRTPETSVALINRTGRMLRQVFEEARRLGIKTCVGAAVAAGSRDDRVVYRGNLARRSARSRATAR